MEEGALLTEFNIYSHKLNQKIDDVSSEQYAHSLVSSLFSDINTKHILRLQTANRKEITIPSNLSAGADIQSIYCYSLLWKSRVKPKTVEKKLHR